MTLRIPLLAFALILAPEAFAGEAWTTMISGEVRAGEDFVAPLPNGLLFVLRAEKQAPPNPPGWKIAMQHSERPEIDLVWPTNPPYRYDNVRYLDLSYGKTPEYTLEWNPREFLFYPDPDTAETAAEWVRGKLWQDEQAPDRPEARGRGVLTILDSRIGVVNGERAVAWLRFEVRLTAEPAPR